MNNYDNKEECFFVQNYEGREGEEIEAYELKNSKEEARKILELVQREIEKGIELNEICVMFRTHQQGRIIKRTLELESIPYVSVSKGSLLKNKDVKKTIYYLTILDKLNRKRKGGEDAWWGLIYELGFPEQDLIKIGKFIKKDRPNRRDNGNTGNEIKEGKEESEVKEELTISEKLFNEFLLNKELQLTEQGKMLSRILLDRIKSLQLIKDKEVTELIKEVYNISNVSDSEATKEERERTRNLSRFFDLAKDHSSIYSNELGSFIDYLSILDSLGIDIESADNEEAGIRLMTLHSTKGLEYKTVIVSNLAGKRFPIERINSNFLIPLEIAPEFLELKHLSGDELEYYYREYERKYQLLEERRLCYVAFTRAKNKLILMYAQDYGGKKHYPSTFLNEIEYKSNKDIVFKQDLEEKFKESIREKIQEKEGMEFVSGLEMEKEKKDKSKNALSPSALLLFADCQKEFEYKYLYNMPEKKTISWDAIKIGSFIHLVLEKGVKENFRELKQFIDYAKELHLEEEWEDVNLSDVIHLTKVFYARNKDKYNEKSRTEQFLKANFEGISFVGFADRIDFRDDGLEIVDYKTGKSIVDPRAREWQLGYYALAASKYGKVKRITLDMLKQDSPIEFELDDDGNAISINNSLAFNIYDVQDEIVQTAKQIQEAYKKGFKPCPIEENCEFCNEYVYNL